jgi:inorganic pyrophosphatase
MKNKYKDNPLFNTDIGDVPNSIKMFVEIPKGSINKYEYDVETGRIVLDRVIYEMLPYPVEYGLIPQTWDEDDDMLDVMCMVNYPTFPGCEIDVRVVGVMEFLDDGEVDDKLLAVPENDVRFEHVKDISDLPEHTIDEIGFFFKHYKELQFKYKNKPQSELIVKGFSGQERAIEILNKAKERFNKKFS